MIRVVKEEDHDEGDAVGQPVRHFDDRGRPLFTNQPYSLFGNLISGSTAGADSDQAWRHVPAAGLRLLWTRYVNPTGWSFIRQIGTTSLLVYWVHTEIVYAAGCGLEGIADTRANPGHRRHRHRRHGGLSVARTGWNQWPGFPALAKARWERLRAETMQAPRATDPLPLFPFCMTIGCGRRVWQTT